MKPKTVVPHTPLPWEIADKTRDAEEWDGRLKLVADLDNVQIWGPTERGGSYPENIANAAFIVQAVNSHEKLLEHLREASAVIEVLAGQYGHTAKQYRPMIDRIRQAISVAEGRE